LNVHRPSGSRTASVTLFRDSGSVTLEIMDQGRGIRGRFGAGSGGLAELGVGIAGMRERVRQLGGDLDVRGDEGGTAVRVVLPLPAAEVPAARTAESALDVAV
jgi:signal transduction histidine kinase